MLGDDGQVLFDGVLYPSRNNYPRHHRAVRACQREGQCHRGTSISLTMWTGRVSLLHTASAWEPDPGPLEPDDEASQKRKRTH